MPLITFEGIDGSGKGTQIHLLRKKLRGEGVQTVVFREPGGTALSERVRSVLLDSDLHIEPLPELLLFSAARSQLCSEKIRPLLDRGITVLLDRFYDSTVAYQGGGRRIGDFDWLSEFNARVTGNLVPDRTYYLRISLEAARRRRQYRASDRLEAGGDEFFRRVYETYERIAREHTDRVVIIDADRPPEDIASLVWDDARTLVRAPEPGSIGPRSS